MRLKLTDTTNILHVTDVDIDKAEVKSGVLQLNDSLGYFFTDEDTKLCGRYLKNASNILSQQGNKFEAQLLMKLAADLLSLEKKETNYSNGRNQ